MTYNHVGCESYVTACCESGHQNVCGAEKMNDKKKGKKMYHKKLGTCDTNAKLMLSSLMMEYEEETSRYCLNFWMVFVVDFILSKMKLLKLLEISQLLRWIKDWKKW
eukprot:6305133-Ditylum_brightwellii.AAC.1